MSMRARFSTPSTKRRGATLKTVSNASAAPDARRYRVELHPRVAKTVALHGGLGTALFRPSLNAALDELEIDPKRYPKKQGRLRAARALPLRYSQSVVWRMVYTIDERARVVRIVGLGPHDRAYEEAERRI